VRYLPQLRLHPLRRRVPGAQQFDRRVVPESKEQLKRFILWDGGAVDDDAQLALLGAAGERRNALRQRADVGGALHKGSRVTSISETNR
jgi:hypothetical protein